VKAIYFFNTVYKDRSLSGLYDYDGDIEDVGAFWQGFIKFLEDGYKANGIDADRQSIDIKAFTKIQ
jgi:hypothetical protein